MEWARAVTAWCDWLRAGGHPSTTVGLRRCHVMRFGADAPSGPWETTGLDICAWMGRHRWAAETRRSYRASLAGFYSWALRSGFVERDPMLDVPRARPGHHAPRPAPDDALSIALAGADDRTRLMLQLAAYQGLRRGEIARVRCDDASVSADGWTLLVRGKGDRQRVIPLAPSIAYQIQQRGEGWCFPGGDHGHLSPARVGELISARLPDGWTAHTLRHRFATRAYAGSRDLAAVQALLGHAKPETTMRYVQLPRDAMREAMRWAA